MATPNQMPKKSGKVAQSLLASLIEKKDTSWNRKLNDDETVVVKRESLRWPLAQNVSDDNVERLAGRWA